MAGYVFILLVVLILLIVFAFWIDQKRPEFFATSNSKQTLTTNRKNFPAAEEVTVDFMSTLVRVLETGAKIPDNWQGTTICIDALDEVRVSKGNRGKGTKMPQEGYFIRLVLPDRAQEWKVPQDIATKKIGVLDIPEKHLVQAMAYGYRLPTKPPVLQTEFIPRQEWSQFRALLEKRYDIIFAYILPGSEMEKMIYAQEVRLLGFDGIDITRLQVTFPYLRLENSFMTDVYNWKNTVAPKAIYPKEGRMELIWGSLVSYVIGEPVHATPTSPEMEAFITRLEVSNEMSDPAYRCYGETTNENRALCNSPFDPWGRPKKTQTHWDIPCTENAECPFYRANQNYPNKRGGCLIPGVCELPVGIRRVSYRKYKDDFPFLPMCYGCAPEVTDCCKDQKAHPDRYRDLSTPDYAFQDDIRDRAPRGLPVVISLPSGA